MKTILKTVGLVFLIGFMFAWFGSNPKESTATSSVARTVEPTKPRTLDRTIIAFSLGCTEKDTLKELFAMNRQGDEVAVNKMVTSLKASGKCRYFGEGAHVFLDDSAIGFRRIRPAGETEKFWVVSENVGKYPN